MINVSSYLISVLHQTVLEAQQKWLDLVVIGESLSVALKDGVIPSCKASVRSRVTAGMLLLLSCYYCMSAVECSSEVLQPDPSLI